MNEWETRDRMLRLLGYLSYSDYLRSFHWSQVKKAFYSGPHWGGRCYCCQRLGVRTELHHKTYEHIGCEIEWLKDLVAVCGPCHDKIHVLAKIPEPKVGFLFAAFELKHRYEKVLKKFKNRERVEEKITKWIRKQ